MWRQAPTKKPPVGCYDARISKDTGKFVIVDSGGTETVLAETSQTDGTITSADITDAVMSVAGRTGAVVIAQADVTGLKTTSTPEFSGVKTNSGGIVVDATGTISLSNTTHNGKILVCTCGTAVAITAPVGNPRGFACKVIRAGAGSVTFAGDGTSVVNSYGSVYEIVGQHADALICCYAENTYNLSGNLT